jgi:hypothetical protein
VAPFSVQRSPLSALDDDAALEELLAQQERWLVERKQDAEIAAVAKEIASFANTDGGWLLIGVEDKDGPEGPVFRRPMDKLLQAPHHWLGQKLPSWLDPLPAFDAATVRRGADEVVVVRVWPAAQAPIVHRGSGVIYERGAEEAIPIKRLDRVRELVHRRNEAEHEAAVRLGVPGALPALASRLAVPNPQQPRADGLTFLVRLTPWAFVPEAFAPVALSHDAVDAASTDVRELLLAFGSRHYANWQDTVRSQPRPRAEPFQRGFSIRDAVTLDFGHGYKDNSDVVYAADAGGVIGMRLRRVVTSREVGGLELHASVVSRQWLYPMVSRLADRLATRYAPGMVRFDLWALGLGDKSFVWDASSPTTQGAFSGPYSRGWVQAHADVVLPATTGELADICDGWTADLAREAGIAVFE